MNDEKESIRSSNTVQINNLMDWQGQFEAVFASLPVGISYLTPDMRYIRINPFLEEKIGKKSDEIAGRFCYETNGMYKDDPTRSGREKICDPCGIVKALETGEPFKFTRKNNENFIVENMGVPIKDANGNILGLVEIIVDITERVRMEERLQQHASQLETAVDEKTRELYKSRSLLDNIIQGTTDAIFTLDGEGRFCYMNSAVEDVFGYPREGLFEKPIAELLLAADKEKVMQTLGPLEGKEAPLHNLKLVNYGSKRDRKIPAPEPYPPNGRGRQQPLCRRLQGYNQGKEAGIRKRRFHYDAHPRPQDPSYVDNRLQLDYPG